METNKNIKGVLVGAAVAVIAVILTYAHALDTIHLSLSNLLFTANSPSSDIAIVAIDEKSLDASNGLGRYNDWPRTYFVQALQNIEKYKPAVIAVDIDFSAPSKGLSQQRVSQIVSSYEHSESPDLYPVFKEIERGINHPDDIELENTVLTAGNILLLNAGVVGDGAPVPLGDGFAFAFPDRDDVVRKTLLIARDAEGKTLKSMDVQAVENFLGKEVDAPAGEVLINYSAKTGSYNKIPFVDVMADRNIGEEDFKGKIVLLGATARILQDVTSVPNSDALMSGVEVHANVIQQLIENKPLVAESKGVQVGVVAFLALGSAVAFVNIPLALGIAAMFLVVILYWIAAWFLFNKGILIDLIYGYVALILSFVAIVVVRYFTEMRAKLYLKRAFSHYVNESVVEQITAHPEMLRLGGERKKIAVLFSDIVSFTSLAEKMEPEQVVDLLNEYMDVMTKIIFQNGGTLDKYEGDAIMAFFGAPLPTSNFVEMACRSAIQMQGALAGLHEKWNSEGKPLIDFRVGISTGEVIVGNLGSHDRFDYTVIGDTVNLGARLESANRRYGTRILVDAATRASANISGHEIFIFRQLDLIRVKGKSEPTLIYDLIGENGAVSPDIMSALHDFSEGYAFYEKRRFNEAVKYFNSSDGATQVFKARCEEFIKRPPRDDWDGVVDLEGK